MIWTRDDLKYYDFVIRKRTAYKMDAFEDNEKINLDSMPDSSDLGSELFLFYL